MFCYQCEQTAKGTGCTTAGVCGKDAKTASLQDLLLFQAKHAAKYAVKARLAGKSDRDADVYIIEALFTTVTNVNFDPERVAALIKHGNKTLAALSALSGAESEIPPVFKREMSIDEMVVEGAKIAITERFKTQSEEIVGLYELIAYGLKGAAAYAHHAWVLENTDESVFARFAECLAFLTEDHTADELLGMALKVGALNLDVMALLDKANTGTYGHPVPTSVRVTPKKGKAILVSGHDLKDLEELLKQTEGTGSHVYTPGEMRPAHGYPKLKKYAHLAGNDGGAWQDQRKEFNDFKGAILMTTNCIQKPQESYVGRIFTSGLVAFPGVVHIGDRNFKPVIEAALAAEGYAEDCEDKNILVGFGHNAVMSVADKVIDLVKAGKIKHFFLVGGCDGAKSGRNYYTDLAQSVPQDCVILTLACGKYRFNKLDFGDIEGIPRLLDVGQCNDAYSAIQIAVALAGAFGTDVNGLPLSMILSWYEQKAVAILLTLLHLGVKNIKLGPSLPAFIKPAVLNVLVEKFAIAPISTPQEDLKAALG